MPSRNLVRLLAQGSTAVGTLEARTPARLEEKGITGSGFTKVVVNTQQAIIAQGGNPQQSSTITVELLGQFGDIEVQSAAAQINLQEGSIQNLILASTAQAAQINLAAQTGINTLVAETPAIVQGQGTVEMLEANVDGVVIEAPAKKVFLADGVQANVAGKTITEGYKYVEPKKKKSKDASLSDLAVNGKKVEGFAPDTLDYTVVLPYGTEKAPVVTATACHAKAQVEITQATGLTALNNTATVLVTAESGATREYTVSFTVALDSAKAITGFKFESSQNDLGAEDVIGTIDETAKTITATVPYGTGVTSLTPTITHTGVSISPESGIAQDFTNSVTTPVKYTVTAANGTTAVYDITVYIALNDEVRLSKFEIGGQDVKESAGVNTDAGATLAVSNFTNFKGIAVQAIDPNASVTVTLKRGETETTVTDLATQAIVANDVIIVTVTAEDGTTKGRYKVTVVPVTVTSVSLNKSETTLQVGASETLTATIAPIDATNKKVNWSSSDDAIATVVDGVVTAVGAGTATITVTTEDGNKTADCAVSVKASVTFTVTDVSKAPISGATVNLDEESITTGADGTAVFSALGGSHAYTVTATGYNEATGTINVAGTAVAVNETVTLAKSTYSVTFSAEGSGTLTAKVDDTAITSGALIEHGKDIVFTAAPNTGYRVQAWKLDGSVLGEEKTTSYTLTNLQAAATVTVIFELIPTYTVTYNGNGSTGGTAPTDEGAYQEGANVTVLGEDDPPTQTGYTFAGWNTAADGSGTAYAADDTFTMGTADVTLYAQWTIADFAADENDVFGTTATFTWSAAIGASSIKIQQLTDEGSTWADATTLGELSLDATTAVVTGLTKNTAYQFKLVVNGGTTAGESNSISVTTKAAAMYGASWDSKKTINTTEMERLGDAVEADNPGFVGYFDNYAPWSGMKRCTMDEQVMVTIPKFYYKHTYADGVHQFWVADGPLETEGFALHPAFRRAGEEKECIYMGAYKASIDTSITKKVTVKGENGEDKTLTVNALASVSGALPAVQKKRYEFRASAKARGDNWCIVDALARNAVALLYLVEYADTNSQSAIGQGITGLRYSAADTVTVATTDARTNDCCK
ncbi:MAG: Ig-like domain-containing protein [Peptococcia bacterium]